MRPPLTLSDLIDFAIKELEQLVSAGWKISVSSTINTVAKRISLDGAAMYDTQPMYVISQIATSVAYRHIEFTRGWEEKHLKALEQIVSGEILAAIHSFYGEVPMTVWHDEPFFSGTPEPENFIATIKDRATRLREAGL